MSSGSDSREVKVEDLTHVENNRTDTVVRPPVWLRNPLRENFTDTGPGLNGRIYLADSPELVAAYIEEHDNLEVTWVDE